MTAGEHSSILIEDFRHSGQSSSAFADLSRFHSQWLAQRHGSEIFDSHAGGRGNKIAQLVQLAHGVVKNGGNNSTMAVPRRAGVALSEPKMRDELPALTIERELQMHAMWIIFAAREAQVLLHRMLFAAVSSSRSLSRHKS